MEHTVGVIGAGTMGAGIALVAARAGYTVRLYDRKREVVAQALQMAESFFDRERMKGRATEREKEECLARLIPVPSLRDLHASTRIVEAVPERIELKKEVLLAVEEGIGSDSLILSNTSSLSITEIASHLAHPKRFLGLHFFNPAPVMPLVEIVKGKRSGAEQVEEAYHFALSLGKTPVIVEDTPGFIVNRIARPYYNEALRLLEERAATPAQLDRIMKEEGGFKMGPFELQDLIGIDVNFATTESVYNQFFQEGRFRPNRIQQRMVQAGLLGRKSGEGYYEYGK